MRGFALFRKTNAPGSWNIASWHSPHSLTWSWCLSFSLFRADERRWWPLFAPYRTNGGLQWILRIPPIGLLQWHRQRPMWFRDIWYRERDERHRAKYEDSEALPVPPPLIQIDGGASLH